MTSNDQQYMQRAIALAKEGLYTTSPNPRVGCVLVRDGRVIGEGFHLRAGEGHAEVNAIAHAVAEVGDVTGATAYVTLEPCSHTGKTPPCCDALINAGIQRVVVAMQDPNPLVAGNGQRRLRTAGVDVEVGIMEAEARALNPGFIKRMETGLPWVRAKLASSLDGRTAMASGESQWITGAPARSDVQRLRAQSCAIVSGVDTVILDNAALTVRADQLGFPDAKAQMIARRQPLRVILDSTLRLPASSAILSQPGHTIVVAAVENLEARKALEAQGAEVMLLPGQSDRVDLAKVLKVLGEAQCNEVLVEAGATLVGAFWQRQFIDALTVYMAPTLLGSEARPLMNLPFQRMSQQQRLVIESITPIGDDWRIDARPTSVEREHS